MQVFVAGATGVLGRRLVEQFADAGHEVVGLVRDDAGEELVRERGGEPHRGDVLEPETLAAGAAGSDVVVHAATAIPTGSRPSREDWARNDRVRREGAEHLLDAARAADADQYVQASVVWLARQPDGAAFDEDAPVNPDRTTESAVDAEELVREATADASLTGTILRFGWFYAADSAQTSEIAEYLEKGRMPALGGGLLGREDATLSTIHADDAASATVAAAEAGVEGTYHVVDEEPVTFAEFLSTFAEHLDAPEPRRIPGWLARPLLGQDAVRLFTSSMPTSNERFVEATGWEPAYPTVDAGLAAVAERLEDEE